MRGTVLLVGHLHHWSWLIEGEPDTQHQIMRVHVFDCQRTGGCCTEVIRDVAAADIADVQIAIAEVDRHAICYLVAETSMQSPNEVRIRTVIAKGNTVCRNVDVFQAKHRIVCKADTSAYIWRDSAPGTKINVSIEKANPAFNVSGIFVGATISRRRRKRRRCSYPGR